MMYMKKVAFITGGSGFIGRYLVEKLLIEGYQLRLLIRNTSKVSHLKKSNVDLVTGDLTIPESYRSALNGVDVVINLAGVVTDWAELSRYHSVHVEGLQALLEASTAHQVKRFVHVSTIDVIEKRTDGVPVNELSPITRSTIPYDRTKAIGEALAIDYAKRHLIEVVALRPAWVYGIGDTTLFPEIAYQTKKGQMVLVGNSNVYVPLVHVKNLCQALFLAANTPDISGEVFIISDGEVTWKELIESIAVTVGGKKPTFVIPYKFAYFLGYLMEIVGRAIKLKKRPLLTRTAVEMLGMSIRIDSNKAKTMLNYSPMIPLKIGIQEALEWLRNNDILKLRIK